MKSNKSKGLGDTIANVTEITGIKKMIDTIAEKTGKPCGCAKRQNKLNEYFPYKNK
tara:strand:+ start:82 stop:249 length:168 start_codon:yes stop_codon:yes gene_type:complete